MSTSVAAPEKATPAVTWTYRARFPGPTKSAVQPVDTPVGRLACHTETYEDENGAFSVATTDYAPETVRARPVDALLDDAARGAAMNMGAELVSARPITVRGFPGREFICRESAGRFFAKARIVLAGRRLVQCLVVCPEERLSAPEVGTFLGSFELVEPSTSTKR